MGIQFWYHWITIAGRDIETTAVTIAAVTSCIVSVQVARRVEKYKDPPGNGKGMDSAKELGQERGLGED
jgi:hypothetical protein